MVVPMGTRITVQVEPSFLSRGGFVVSGRESRLLDVELEVAIGSGDNCSSCELDGVGIDAAEVEVAGGAEVVPAAGCALSMYPDPS